MLGASSWRKPCGYVMPVAASYLHAGNHSRKLGSTVKIDTARDVQAYAGRDVQGVRRSSDLGKLYRSGALGGLPQCG